MAGLLGGDHGSSLPWQRDSNPVVLAFPALGACVLFAGETLVQVADTNGDYGCTSQYLSDTLPKWLRAAEGLLHAHGPGNWRKGEYMI